MSNRRPKPGRTLGLGPPEGQQWAWMTSTMMGALTFRALSIAARRILDRLHVEHMAHAGMENGALVVTYDQFEEWGVTRDDIRRGLEELYVTGFVEQTRQGFRVASSKTPSLYALTWLPTHAGDIAQATPPSHLWMAVLDRLRTEGTFTLKSIKKWLSVQTADTRRGHGRKRSTSPHLRPVPVLKCELEAVG